MSQVLNNKNYPHGHHGDSFTPMSLSQRIQRFTRRNREGILGYSILSPMILLFLLFSVIPIVAVIYLSFTQWNGIMGLPIWVGFKNFHRFFFEDDYLLLLGRAGFYGICILVFGLGIGFLIAMLLNMKVKATAFIRTMWYLPVLVPFVVIAQMFDAIMNPVDGLSKQIMARIGIDPPIIFQQSAVWMGFWIILLSIWKGVGGIVIIYLAGLQGIDPTLYEAARVDGANKAQLLWNVTIPSLRPITMYLLITSIIGSFLIFDPIYLITSGAPLGETNIILYRIFQDAFQAFDLGMASASSVVVLVLTLILALTQYRISQKSIT